MFQRFKRIAWLLAAVVVATVGLTSCKPKDPRRTDAMKSCSDFLKAAAKNPSSAEIPMPNQHKVSNSAQQLEWTHGGGLRFMNNMGAKLDTAAVCTTDASGIIVERLSIDGKIVWNASADIAPKEPTAAPSETSAKRVPVDAAEEASMAAAAAAAGLDH